MCLTVKEKWALSILPLSLSTFYWPVDDEFPFDEDAENRNGHESRIFYLWCFFLIRGLRFDGLKMVAIN